MQKLDEKNCKKLTDLTFEEVLSLSGLLGLYTHDELVSKNQKLYCNINENLIKIDFESDLIQELIVSINLSSRSITVESFKSTGLRKGISIEQIASQVDNARKLGYKHVWLHAFGDPESIKEYNGFCVWGRYGYLMSDDSQKEEFLELMKKNGRKETSLHELQSSVDGKDFWSKNGFDWYGKFITDDDSLSHQILTQELKLKKNINV